MAEKDYLAIAKKKGTRASKMKSFRRIMVYGRNKKGKSRLGVSPGIENVLVIDPEQGVSSMKALDPFVWPISRWEDIQEVYGALRTGKLTPNHLSQGESSTPFSWVSVDGLTRLNNMALNYVRRSAEDRDLDRQPGMIQQRDYGKSGELMCQLLVQFHTLPLNVYYTAQERMLTTGGSFDDDDDADDAEVYLVPDLPNKVRGMVNSLAEVIGRIYVVQIERKGVQVSERRLQIGINNRYDTGYRSDFVLPEVIRKPTLPKLVQMMEEGA